MTLRKAVIKLAFDNPGKVRDAILPLLSKEAASWKPGQTFGVTSYPDGKSSLWGFRTGDKLLLTETEPGKHFFRVLSGPRKGEETTLLSFNLNSAIDHGWIQPSRIDRKLLLKYPPATKVPGLM